MVRQDRWESRFYAVLEDARNKPYVLGEHDCFRLACRVIEALTGVDRWPEFAGYTTERQALRKLAQFGPSFEEAGDWFFGAPRIDLKLARRGDICALVDEAGQKHLAVLVDDRAACMLPAGLLFIEAKRCHCAWRVG